jgi:hypothetical protein
MNRALRRVTGVDEELLDKVPQLRPQYARLGGVVVGTATIAALSMWFALGEVIGHHSALALIPAVLWGLFIANLDAWLIANMSGTHWRSHPWIVLPRLALAIVLGVLIAEPLLLRVFQTAIESQVKQSRQTALLHFQSELVACNPQSGRPLSASQEAALQCGSRIVVVKGVVSPVALRTQIAGAERQQRQLSRRQREVSAHQSQLDRTVQLECSGAHGRGLSGLVGVGINCQTDRANATTNRIETQPEALNAQIRKLSAKITTLQGVQRVDAQTYGRALKGAIKAEVSARQRQQHSIGLLERLNALHGLVQSNWYVDMAQWFLRLFIITIDCLPLIVKTMSGITAYDRLLDEHLASAVRIDAEASRDAEHEKTIGHQTDRYMRDRSARHDREAFDTQLRLETARRRAGIFAEVDKLTDTAMKRARRATKAPPLFERSGEPESHRERV